MAVFLFLFLQISLPLLIPTLAFFAFVDGKILSNDWKKYLVER